MFCFNPSVGILLVWTSDMPPHRPGQPCFNPSVGILLVWTRQRRPQHSASYPVSIPRSGFCWLGPVNVGHSIAHHIQFQSLGRDSVGLDVIGATIVHIVPTSFNPSVGILLVWTDPRTNRIRYVGQFQSLGRDSVGLDQHTADISIKVSASFNPSVGILLVWTVVATGDSSRPILFQSLGRDSVGLDLVVLVPWSRLLLFQSLGRDSVGLDLVYVNIIENLIVVSIPRSGFCWFGLAALV